MNILTDNMFDNMLTGNSTNCNSISPLTTDAWCTSNCNNNPPNCPVNLCSCDGDNRPPLPPVRGCNAISPIATDAWCTSNCNTVPPNCPADLCACDDDPTPPTNAPTASPTNAPTASPTNAPTASPTASPTPSPDPTNAPTASPTASPTPSPETDKWYIQFHIDGRECVFKKSPTELVPLPDWAFPLSDVAMAHFGSLTAEPFDSKAQCENKYPKFDKCTNCSKRIGLACTNNPENCNCEVYDSTTGTYFCKSFTFAWNEEDLSESEPKYECDPARHTVSFPVFPRPAPDIWLDGDSAVSCASSEIKKWGVNYYEDKIECIPKIEGSSDDDMFDTKEACDATYDPLPMCSTTLTETFEGWRIGDRCGYPLYNNKNCNCVDMSGAGPRCPPEDPYGERESCVPEVGVPTYFSMKNLDPIPGRNREGYTCPGNSTPCTNAPASPPSPPPTSLPTPTPSSLPCAKNINDQCGGQDWTGPTCCESGLTCTVQGEWYSQCL